jgi:hypothetical protein
MRMAQYISEIGNALPWNLRFPCLDIVGNAARCFADDLEQSLRRGANDPVGGKLVPGLALQDAIYVADRTQHVTQSVGQRRRHA